MVHVKQSDAYQISTRNVCSWGAWGEEGVYILNKKGTVKMK